jgi:hypothetical protein
VVLGLLMLAGCTRWRAEHVSPAGLLTSESPTRIRVTRVDKSRVELHRPQLVGDTIVDGRAQDGLRTKVPLNDVAQIAVRKWDPFGTTGLILGAAALGAVVTIGLMWDARAD